MKRKGSNMEREYGVSGFRHSDGWEEEDPFGHLYGDGEDDLEDGEDEDEDEEDVDEDEDEDDDYDEEDDDSEEEDEDY